MIVQGLKKFFPSIVIVGEEATEYEGEIDVDFNKISPLFLPPNLEISAEYPSSDVCVWIDPIDCTKGFIGGYVEACTVLIGISVCHKS